MWWRPQTCMQLWPPVVRRVRWRVSEEGRSCPGGLFAKLGLEERDRLLRCLHIAVGVQEVAGMAPR